MKLTLSIIVLSAFMASCALLPPYHTTEVAFVSIHNKTQNRINYKALLSENWTNSFTIKPNQASFLLKYERETKKESVPQGIDEITVHLPNCQLSLNRQFIEAHMTPPASGAAGWELFIDSKLISIVGCA